MLPGRAGPLRALLARPVLLLPLPPLLWASNIVLGRARGGIFPPVTLAAGRWLVALMALLPFVAGRLRAQAPLLCRHWSLAGRGALIFASFPLLTMLTAAGLGLERLTWSRTLGVLLTIAGVGLALGDKAVQPGAANHGWAGELAVLAAALCGAVCSVLYRPYLNRYPAPQSSAHFG